MKTILVYCWGSFSEPLVIRAMEEAGNKVVAFSGEMKDYHSDAEFAQKFMASLHSEDPEMVFSYDYFPLLSMICEINSIPYAAWIYDCPQRLLLSKTIINSCNHIFCFDEVYTGKLQNLGARHAYHFPLAADVDMYERVKEKWTEDVYACDVSFVGGLYNGEKNRLLHTTLSEYAEGYVEGILSAQKEICGYNLVADALSIGVAEEIVEKCEMTLSDVYTWDTIQMAADAVNMKLTALDRKETLTALLMNFESKRMECEKHPIVLTLYSYSRLPQGLDGNQHLVCKGTVDYRTEMPLVFHNSKINLNITSRTIESGIPQRVFDVLACSGFCLTNYQSEIAALFEDGKELVMYTDMEDLVTKVDYYLNHEEERMQIAKAGYRKVCNCFALKDRIEKLINLALCN